MRPISELNALQTMGSIIGSGGTVTSVGTAISPTYEPFVGMLVNVGANAAGAIVATLQSSAALGSGYTDVGTVSAGTLQNASLLAAGSLTGQYVRTIVTATGGTSNCTTSLIVKARTVTN